MNVRPCQGAVSQFLAVRLTTMGPYMHMRYATSSLFSLY